jgi:nucleoid DNA-binding protein
MANNKTGGRRPMSKSAVYTELANETGLARRQVGEVFDALSNLIKRELSKKGPGVMSIPGLLKLRVVNKPATKAGMRPNPFKPGEMMEVKAKPARNTVRARPLKSLNELVK